MTFYVQVQQLRMWLGLCRGWFRPPYGELSDPDRSQPAGGLAWSPCSGQRGDGTGSTAPRLSQSPRQFSRASLPVEPSFYTTLTAPRLRDPGVPLWVRCR